MFFNLLLIYNTGGKIVQFKGFTRNDWICGPYKNNSSKFRYSNSDYNIEKDGLIIGKIIKEFTLGRDRYLLDVIDEIDIEELTAKIKEDGEHYNQNWLKKTIQKFKLKV